MRGLEILGPNNVFDSRGVQLFVSSLEMFTCPEAFANSHKVIRNLLDKVVEAADELGIEVQCIQKPDEKQADVHRIRFTTDNAVILGAIGAMCQVAGGTTWLWSREDAFEAVDVLFVDEAAQMSLANVLAVSQACKTLVLLGDPQQLEQPMKGSHPEGTEVSALDHMLAGDATIGPDQGLFLEETWRLHSQICRFTSELFYEGSFEPSFKWPYEPPGSCTCLSGRIRG